MVLEYYLMNTPVFTVTLAILLEIFIPAGFATSVLWFIALRLHAHGRIWIACVLSHLLLLYMYHWTVNWMMLAVFCVYAFISVVSRREISKVCDCLMLGLQGLAKQREPYSGSSPQR